MKFGTRPLSQAEGSLLAYSFRREAAYLPKGCLLDKAKIEILQQAGIDEILVATLDDGDIQENIAAQRLAKAAAGDHLILQEPVSGRCNLYASVYGILQIDQAAVLAANKINPSITLACLHAYSRVRPQQMIATAKIISFAVSEKDLCAAENTVRQSLRVAPLRARNVGLLSTRLAHIKTSVLDKARRNTEIRLQDSGSKIIAEERPIHERDQIAKAIDRVREQGADFLIIFGASAIADIGDEIPSAIESAGGRIIHFGLPVDPGNLALLAEIGSIPVIGAPGCARALAANGFDWVLDRLLAGINMGPEEIAEMSIGGLLRDVTRKNAVE